MEPVDLPLKVVRPGDDDYQRARVKRVANGKVPERFPIAVVEAISVADVVAAVKLARRVEAKISVRSGGHSWPVWSLRDNAILIDLGAMRSIQFDEKTGIVEAGPAVTGEDLTEFLQERGRFFNCGHCPGVALGGFLYSSFCVKTDYSLQGGMGWNCRGWGWAAESIVGIEVVTADGNIMDCDLGQNSDLFWAARGSGPGFFAVVTQFRLQTRLMPKGILKSTYIWNVTEYDIIMPWIINTSPLANPNMEITLFTCYIGQSETTSDLQNPSLVLQLLTFTENVETARESLHLFSSSRPLQAHAIHIEECRPASIRSEFERQHEQNPIGYRFSADSAWIPNHLSTAEVVRIMKELFVSLPSRKSYSMYYNMTSTRTLSPMAFSLQTNHYVGIYSIWKDSKDDDKCQSWLQSRLKALESISEGVYIGDSDFQVRPSRFVTLSTWERLTAARNKWDPHRLFCGYLGLDDLG